MLIGQPSGTGPEMEETGTLFCPFCGQAPEVMCDTLVAAQRFIVDCETCCRPFEVVAACEPGRILSLEVR